MLEVNVNRLVTECDPAELSASIMERGKNAGAETWQNSLEAVGAGLLKDESERQAARDYFADFGAWDHAEIIGWSNEELDALVLQYAAGDLREAQDVAEGDGLGGVDWTRAELLANTGRIAGNLFIHENELWISLSH